MPKQRAESGYVSDYNGRASVEGIEPAMSQMPEKNVRSMALTEFPDMSQSPFSAGNFSEPEFKATTRT
jgi:hypothetical protein